MISTSRFLKWTSLLLASLLSASLALGQGIVTGSVSGTVFDQQKAVITNANVTAVHSGTNEQFAATSNSEGFFALHNLPIGAYTVRIEAPGFTAITIKDVQVQSSKDTVLGSQTLMVGASAELVNVEATAPIVDSGSSQITDTFTEKQIADLPIGSGLDNVALYVPGVVSAGAVGFGNSNGPQLSINGQRTRSNNFQIDGQANNDNSVTGPSIALGNADLIAEYQVITNYTAQYGRNTGGVINYVTKAGTNQYHGSAFELYEGNAFDSLDNTEKSPTFGFCAPGVSPSTGCTQAVVPRFVDNRFGGTIGGPVKHDKVWFFGSYYGERQRSGGTASQSAGLVTPTPNGINQLKSLFPNNRAVAALASFGPTAVKVGSPVFTPTGNVTVSDGTTSGPVEFGTIQRNVPSLFNDHEATGRVDYQISPKDHFFGRYIFQQNITTGVAGNSIAAGDWVDVPARDQQIGLDYVRTLTNSFVNQVRFSFSRARFGFEGGSYSCLQGSILTCPTFINIASGTDQSFGRATNLPQGRLVNVTEYQDNATWSHGNHTLKFGGEYVRQRSPNVFLPNINGSFTFPTFNAFLQNAPSSFGLTDGPTKFNFKEKDAALYLQDDIRLKDNFTVFVGLRWEFFQQAINLLHDLSVATQTGSTPFWDTTLPLSLTTVPHIPEDTNNFGPNVGFAWTPRLLPRLFGENKTVFRGGFRVAYDPAYYNIFLNTATAAPVVNSGTCTTAAPCNGVIPGLPSGSSFTGNDIRAGDLGFVPRGVNPGLRSQTPVDPHFRNPYAEEWHFGLQREVTSKLATEIRYEGSHSIGSLESINVNPALNALIKPTGVPAGTTFANLIPSGLTPCTDATKPGGVAGYIDCNHRNVTQRGNYGFGIYHALVTQLRIANYHGLGGTVGYTWAHNIDNVSEVFSRSSQAGLNSIAPNPFDINRPERANSSIDFPNVVSIALNYEVPFFRSQSGWMGHALGGWQLNTTYRYSSGEPWTPIQSKKSTLCDPTSTFSSATDACRPILSNASAPLNSVGQYTFNSSTNSFTFTNVSGGAATTPSAVHWIVNNNAAAAVLGSPFLGVGRNTLRGDTINNANLSVFKTFKITERISTRFQATAFNVMNRQFRGVPGTNILTSSTFANTFSNPDGRGDVNATEDGVGRRRLQFGAKIIF